MKKTATVVLVAVLVLSIFPLQVLAESPDVYNMWIINSKELIWKDALGDQGHQKDTWLPGGTSSHFDIKEFRVTTDGTYLYFLVTFNDMSNIQLGYNGGTFLDIAIDYRDGGTEWLAGMSGLKTSINWDYQLVVNLADPNYHGLSATVNLTEPGNWGKIFYAVNSNWQQLSIPEAKMSVNISNNAIEIALPVSMFSGDGLPSSINIAVMTAPGWADGGGSGGVWGEAFDFVSTQDSDTEKSDGVLNYVLSIDLEKISSHNPISVDGDPSDWPGQFILPKPELTIDLNSDVFDVEPNRPANLTITASNIGNADATNVTVELYDNDALLKSWTVNIPAGESLKLWYLYEYSGYWGTHTFKAVVDPNNTVEEVNEDNNVDTITLDVGRLPKLQNTFVMHNMFYGTRHFEKDYPRYNELDQQLRNMPLPEDAKERLDEIQNEVLDLVKLYNEGKDMITQPNYAFMGAMRIYRAYTGLKKIIGEMEEMLRKAQEGEYEHEKYMEELAKNLTKNIDGNLDDWSVKPVAVDDTGFGQDGANLKALYVDYDNQFLYIALTTENKASWRVAYGIALDYKDGGYTTGADAWGRKVSFTNGVDAQLYFFWNGEFFGDLGTSNITSAQLVLWNGTAWKYEDLKWVGFYAYTGGAQNGLQTLEIAVPWTAIGGEPEKLRIVAYVTGQGSGDSAVDVLPLQEAVKDNAPGDEWGDADTFSEFAVVTIE